MADRLLCDGREKASVAASRNHALLIQHRQQPKRFPGLYQIQHVLVIGELNVLPCYAFLLVLQLFCLENELVGPPQSVITGEAVTAKQTAIPD